MAASSTENAITQTFLPPRRKCYVDWDKFCVSSLDTAKTEIRSKRVFRYKSVDDIKAEEGRIRHVTEGVTDIQEFIEEHGWSIFIAVAMGFGVVVGGAVAAGGGAAASGGVTAFILSNPLTALVAGTAMIGGSTVVAYYGYKLYKHKELVVKVKNILMPIKKDFDRHQPGYNKPNKPIINQLFHQSVTMVIERVYECEIMVDDVSIPIDPICLCGAVLKPVLNTDCYGNEYSYVICDICDQAIHDKKDVFHCPKKKIKVHPHGYDICIKCARKNNERFKRYHAVIIQTLPENGKHIACKDAPALKSLFQSLHYHEIIVIKEQDATKRKIKRALQKMSLNNKNDVVVICYSGHGEKYGSHWKCELESKESLTDQELVESIKSKHGMNQSFGATCDVVIFLNACYSGRFKVKESKKKPKLQDTKKMPRYLSQYDELGRNMITIAACQSNENANFYGGAVSPFYKLVIEELKSNENATPKTVHEYVKIKSNENITDLGGFTLGEMQNVQKAFKKGKYALYVPLCPAVKKY